MKTPPLTNEERGYRGERCTAPKPLARNRRVLPRVLPPSLHWRFGFRTLSFQNPHRPPLKQTGGDCLNVPADSARVRRCQPSQLSARPASSAGNPHSGRSRPQSSRVQARKPSVSLGGRAASQRTIRPLHRARARTRGGCKVKSEPWTADARELRGEIAFPGIQRRAKGAQWSATRHCEATQPTRRLPRNPRLPSNHSWLVRSRVFLV